MIEIINLSYGFPNKEIFENISLTIEEGEHAALIGSSGNGKTTLVEMLVDDDHHHYSGKIIRQNPLRVGYISQFSTDKQDETMTVFDYIAKDFRSLERQIDALCASMSDAKDLEKVMADYQEALDAFDAVDGHQYEVNIAKLLHTAGLTHLRDQSINVLSGGEFKLIQTIKEMMLQPELLIMDEPDAFLDFENLIALKTLINQYDYTLIVITHSRFLLNHCFNKIIHLENHEVQVFDGSYEAYKLSMLETKIELQELSIKDDEEIERNEALINKLRLIATHNAEASRGRALKARVKIQERLLAKRIKAPFVNIPIPTIYLPEPNPTFIEEETRPTSPLLSLNDYHLSFDKTLLSDVTFDIGFGEKVALVGGNGTGKTSILRDIYKHAVNQNHIETDSPLEVDEDNDAHIQILSGVQVGYLSQLQNETLDETASLTDSIVAKGYDNRREVASILRRFGFNENRANQRISALSGGEKNLFQLARLSLEPVDLLLLDEPSSHMDIYSQMAFETALTQFKGGVIMVSHDYYTIANTMDYVLLIEDQKIRKLSARKFRKMIYQDHFDKDYLAYEQDKRNLETQVEKALSQKDFETAKAIAERLKVLIES